MTFEEILDQAMAMLQRRGRLTYGALKRQFQLDDAALEDVKNELIYGQRLAVDEDERVPGLDAENRRQPHPPRPRRPRHTPASWHAHPWPPPPRTSPKRFSSPARARRRAQAGHGAVCGPEGLHGAAG